MITVDSYWEVIAHPRTGEKVCVAFGPDGSPPPQARLTFGDGQVSCTTWGDTRTRRRTFAVATRVFRRKAERCELELGYANCTHESIGCPGTSPQVAMSLGELPGGSDKDWVLTCMLAHAWPQLEKGLADGNGEKRRHQGSVQGLSHGWGPGPYDGRG